MVDVDIIQHWNENNKNSTFTWEIRHLCLCITTKVFSNLFQIPENQSDLKKSMQVYASGNPNIDAWIMQSTDSGIQIVTCHMCFDPFRGLEEFIFMSWHQVAFILLFTTWIWDSALDYSATMAGYFFKTLVTAVWESRAVY